MKTVPLIGLFFIFSYIGFSQDYPKIKEIDVKTKKGEINASEFPNTNLPYNNTQKPLFVLNAKIISYNQFSEIKSETIKRIHILKNKKATNKYGEIAKNGVIEITLNK